MRFLLQVLLLSLVSIFSINAQQLSIDEQFEDLIKSSNNYQEYKVVKKLKINTLRSNVLDSIKNLESAILNQTAEINSQKDDINSLSNELENTKTELTVSKSKEDGINVFGILTNKTTYNITTFSIIGILSLIIIVLFFKFKSGFDIIKSTKEKLVETEEEFESFRQRSLEREQQIRRKLQDEINKNKA